MSAAQPLRASRAVGERAGIAGSGGRRRLPLRPLAARLVRIPAVVADQMVARIGDVLRDLRQEIERIEHLEVAGRSGQQFLVARFGESAHGVVLGLVDHLARPRSPRSSGPG